MCPFIGEQIANTPARQVPQFARSRKKEIKLAVVLKSAANSMKKQPQIFAALEDNSSQL